MRRIRVPLWSLALATLAGCDRLDEPTGPGRDLSPSLSHSSTVTFHAFFSNENDETRADAFEAEAGAQSTIVVDFDAIAAGTDITGQTLSGITFQLGNVPAPSAPLIVVRGADTYTTEGYRGIITGNLPYNKLIPTSGEHVLSPGGVELRPGQNHPYENDDLQIIFEAPVSAVGFDLLLQSQDCCSYADIKVYDAAGTQLYSAGIPTFGYGGGGEPGGDVFIGFVSASKNIARIVINDFDNDDLYADANIGFDSFRLIVDAVVTPPEIVDVDVTAPQISVAESPITLWAPNHAMHTISIADFVTGASDDRDGGVGADDVVITSISSDEPDNGLGDGDTANDMVIAAGCRSMELRAERAGRRNGRVYTIHVAVADATGNVGRASFKIHAPLVLNRTAVDDGPAHSVAGCAI